LPPTILQRHLEGSLNTKQSKTFGSASKSVIENRSYFVAGTSPKQGFVKTLEPAKNLSLK